jgi:hypothetical protein
MGTVNGQWGTVGLDASGCLEVLIFDIHGTLWGIWQTPPNLVWSGWQSLGSPQNVTINTAPALAANGPGPLMGPGRLELFVVGQDNALWHIWQDDQGEWSSGWQSIGGSVTGIPGVGKNPDSGARLEVFAKGTDTALWHVWQNAPNLAWSGWVSLGGQVNDDAGAPVLGLNQGAGPLNNCLHVFVLANASGWNPGSHYDYLNQMWPAGNWSGWTSLGGWQGGGSSSVAQNQDGRLELFARGQSFASSGDLSHNWQTEAATNSWSGWNSLGSPPPGPITSIAAASNFDGRIEVFGISGGALWHIWQTSPNNGWSGWASLAAPPVPGLSNGTNCMVGRNQDGRLEVFVVGSDGALWHIWQTWPNLAWSGWVSLGNTPGP